MCLDWFRVGIGLVYGVVRVFYSLGCFRFGFGLVSLKLDVLLVFYRVV